MFKSSLIGLILVAGFSWAGVASAAKSAKCVLTVNGTVYMSGACKFDGFGGDGSFQISSPNSRYFAYVLITSPGVAQGSWNGVYGESHAHTPLGTLTRKGACWTNSYAMVCAQ